MALYEVVYDPNGALIGTVIEVENPEEGRERVRQNRLRKLTDDEVEEYHKANKVADNPVETSVDGLGGTGAAPAPEAATPEPKPRRK